LLGLPHHDIRLQNWRVWGICGPRATTMAIAKIKS